MNTFPTADAQTAPKAPRQDGGRLPPTKRFRLGLPGPLTTQGADISAMASRSVRDVSESSAPSDFTNRRLSTVRN